MRDVSAPGWGALLGATWAAVLVALVGFLGIAPPDRLLLFGALGLGVAGGAAALTQRKHMRSRSFIAAVAAGAFLGAFALTGIPEYVAGGQADGPCEIRIDTSPPLGSPTTLVTSSRDPLDLGSVDALRWVSTAPKGLTEWRRDLGLRIGGFDLVVLRDTPETASVKPNDGGVVDVEEVLERVESTLGVAPTGVYHVIASLEAPDADCTVSAYLRLGPAHPWDGPLLVTLWILVLATPAVTAVVGHRMRRAARAQRADQSR
ncbi:MAG: hypothetical protein CVT64_05325 [Actinobacteria bacterium HGW-Actinobacteria-4]|nr:MAG: hypothetical protein CVT64_05325 [Actinobacteria bacterium HGW-Actinobacteria-4]